MPKSKSVPYPVVEQLMRELFGDPTVRLMTTADVARHLGTSTATIRKLRCDMGSKGGPVAAGKQLKGWTNVPGVRGARIHPRTYLSQLPSGVWPTPAEEAAA